MTEDGLVVVLGLQEAKDKLADLDPKKARAAERASLRAAATLLQREAQRRAPRNTGRLATQGIKVSVSVSMTKAEAQVGTNRVGMFNELGTRPHTIRPRRGSVLRIFGRFFRGAIEHPGMPARPFLRPALDAVKEQMPKRYAEFLTARIRRLTGG